ncbi:hypothetical protein CAPTEDRAFT_186809 [Capitella teleta]|uniref:Uncharacterized protein n=1 Tax=Capitella teleta TaxID=283909 RepID=R7T7P4_CAPTE|nr:hypothetical protein CAPTEDRAFT_186809 [Capitella teleta]|eukprot:ELT87024.1 hypothetical protein CAPTEDRAFT_186809 [Capitella teleta]
MAIRKLNPTRRITLLSPVKSVEHTGAMSLNLLNCSVRYFCGGAMLIFVGSVMLCAFGFTVVLPYKATNPWPQIAVVYNVTKQHIAGFQNLQNYSHGDQLRGFIYRSWSDAYFKTPKPSYSFYWTFGAIGRIDGDLLGGFIRVAAELARHIKCSLHECGDEEWNIKETRRFRYLWGQPDMTYPCYYNPEDPEQAILERITYAQAVHAIAWPSAALGAGILIWLGLCLGCWKIEMDQNQEPIIDRTSGFL